MTENQRGPALDFVWWNPNNAPLRAWTCDGILCAIAPGMSSINGYVQVPQGNPLYGVPYDQVDVDVHGGLTFGPDRPGLQESMKRFAKESGVDLPPRKDRDGDDLAGWIGFDTAHGFDYWPEEELVGAGVVLDDQMRQYREIVGDMSSRFGREHQEIWTEERLIQEVNHLARQVAAAGRA